VVNVKQASRLLAHGRFHYPEEAMEARVLADGGTREEAAVQYVKTARAYGVWGGVKAGDGAAGRGMPWLMEGSAPGVLLDRERGKGEGRKGREGRGKGLKDDARRREQAAAAALGGPFRRDHFACLFMGVPPPSALRRWSRWARAAAADRETENGAGADDGGGVGGSGGHDGGNGLSPAARAEDAAEDATYIEAA